MVTAFLVATATFLCLSASPASADFAVTLCKVNAEVCKKTNYLGEAFTATSEASFNFGELGTFKCSSSMSRNAEGQLSSLSFTGCTEGCQVTPSNLPYATTLFRLSGGNGEIMISGGVSGEPVLGVLCGGIECAYHGGIRSEFKGGSPATILVSQALTKKTGSFLCPKSPKWEATYKFTSPETSAYILNRAVEGPVFCIKNEKVCPQSLIGLGTGPVELKPSTSAKITKLVGGALSCESAVLYVEPFNPYIVGPYLVFKYFFSCTHPTYTECSVDGGEEDNGYLFPSSGGNGEIAVKARSGIDPWLLIKCSSAGTPFACKYSTEEYGVGFTGGVKAQLEELASMTRLEGSATFCPASIVVQATYESPEPLYMTEA